VISSIASPGEIKTDYPTAIERFEVIFGAESGDRDIGQEKEIILKENTDKV
jgi:hypothetical protein